VNIDKEYHLHTQMAKYGSIVRGAGVPSKVAEVLRTRDAVLTAMDLPIPHHLDPRPAHSLIYCLVINNRTYIGQCKGLWWDRLYKHFSEARGCVLASAQLSTANSVSHPLYHLWASMGIDKYWFIPLQYIPPELYSKKPKD
jgi:hypothetical protein